MENKSILEEIIEWADNNSDINGNISVFDIAHKLEELAETQQQREKELVIKIEEIHRIIFNSSLSKSEYKEIQSKLSALIHRLEQ